MFFFGCSVSWDSDVEESCGVGRVGEEPFQPSSWYLSYRIPTLEQVMQQKIPRFRVKLEFWKNPGLSTVFRLVGALLVKKYPSAVLKAQS